MVNTKKRIFRYFAGSICLLLFFFVTIAEVQGQQDITHIYTNYNGWWSSGQGAINPKWVDDTNILLGFKTADGKTYATGVDNNLLDQKGISYHPEAEYEALPVEKIEVNSGSYIGVPYMWQGTPQLGGGAKTGYYNLPEDALTYYLTDGAHGLDLGTAIFNINAGFNSEYIIKTINPAEIGKASTPPDIIVTQMGQPGNPDRFKFVDENGHTVGGEVTVSLGNAPPLGQTIWAFFNPTSVPYRYSSSQPGNSNPAQNTRDIRMIVFDLEDFGLNASNISQVKKFIHVLGGQSDPAFVGAYNKNAFSFFTADLGVEKEVDKSGPVSQNDQVEFTITVTNHGPDDATNVSVTDKLPSGYTYVSHDTETGTYLPGTGEWSIGSLYNGNSVTLTIIATVNGTGNLSNVAKIEKADQSDPNLQNNTATAGVVLGGRSIELVKVGEYEDTNGDGRVNLGDHIKYTFTVTNTGSVTLTNVVIDDPTLVFGAVPVTPSTLAPNGGVGTVIRKYPLKLSDLKAGKVFNEATATGKDPELNNITDRDEEETILIVSNYWHGTISHEWADGANWTGGWVPDSYQDVEFATVDNNPEIDGEEWSGTAKRDLHLDNVNQPYTPGGTDRSGGRIIGNLVNNSGRDLVITAGNQLIIHEKVIDNQPDSGTIVVKIAPDISSGTLRFNDPDENRGVGAIVEFYNKAYDCADCGFYTRSWQYFGIPVAESGTVDAPFPFTSVEEVNEWRETEPSTNKWVAVDPINRPLTSFTGYQITRNEDTEPDQNNAFHNFTGTLNVDDAAITLTKTDNVTYSGVHLVANSYTAAIPINSTALQFGDGVAEVVYLFNTGTRDQWRKLNGSSVDGLNAGRYLSVPLGVAGQDGLPTMIPSMHAFMVLASQASDLKINYTALVKNERISDIGGNMISTRSTGASSIPSLMMDVIGKESADRVWIFTKEGTTHGFDNGWDGRKMAESGITQLYVADNTGKDRFQVATVPQLDNVTLGFVADMDGKYTLEFALSDHWTTEEIYLQDLSTEKQVRVSRKGSYTFEAKRGDSGSRFRISSSGNIPVDEEAARITVNSTDAGNIAINNKSDDDCTVSISNTSGKIVQKLEVSARSERVVENISRGTYIVRLQNAVVNDARKIVVR